MQEAMSHFHLFILSIVFMAVIAVLGFLVKRSISQIDKRLSDGDTKFKEVTIDITKMKEQRGLDREYFAKEYVAKDDFIRDIRALDYKIDQVATDVKKLLERTARRDDNAQI